MSNTVDDPIKQKSHRERNAGRKAEKKKIKKQHVQELTDKQKNPKAFTFNSAIKAERRFRRNQDIETKKQHIPLVDRTPVEPPPVVVAIVGPSQIGKSLILRCLIKNYVRQPMANIVGPITVVSSKKSRITFMECNNDINSMIDIAKVADLVLLLIDASFGFEMETIEFLNICQVHGMPRIIGVLNHLDLIKNAKQQRKIKKTLKQRFWTEVFPGAKLFYLSGLLHNEYLRNEIKNLARFISIIKFRPITWRTSHPYILADRIEDLTSPELIRENPKVNRNICLYGYVRGIPLNKTARIHIPGYGESTINDISFLPDPCPLPEQLKKRALVEKERLIYAPFSGVGGVIYDKDAVYVEMGGSHSHKEEETGLMESLINAEETLEQKLQKSEIKLFSDSAPIKSSEVTESLSNYNQEIVVDNGRVRRKVIFPNSEENSGETSIFNKLKEICSDEESNSDIEDENNQILETGKKRKSLSPLSNKTTKNLKFSDLSDAESNLLDKSDNELELKEREKNKKDINEDDDSDGYDDDDDEDEDEDEVGDEDEDEDVEDEDEDEDDDDDDNDEKIRKKIEAKNEEGRKTKVEESKVNSSILPNSTFRNKISEALRLCDAQSEETELQTNSDDNSRIELEMNKSNKENNLMDEESENEEYDDELKWKSNLAQKAQEAFLNRQQNKENLMKLVYGVSETQKISDEDENEKEDDEENIAGIFKVVKEQQQKVHKHKCKDQEDSSLPVEPYVDWLDENNIIAFKHRFITGKWKESENAEDLLKLDDLDDEVYGDFEDLETGQKHTAKETSNAPKELSNDEAEERRKLLEKKKQLKKEFDSEYDNGEGKTYYDELKFEVEKQAELNKTEFEGIDDEIRVQIEGYRPGMYVRVEIKDVHCELITNFEPTYPLIIGGLLPGEENIGCIQARIKKHRWYRKTLKTNDPLILSVGWRRFQTKLIFSKLEDDMKNRMLKYTPEHVACIANFWGPITPQGTGVLAIPSVSKKEQGFSIAATGSIITSDKSTEIFKKLKLIGTPLKIFKKTAFIENMFTSSLEVSKFQGVKIKTVSGIRGQIKKAISKPEGCFRATFEDKILLSDIVFCRTWTKVSVCHFYYPVINLLLPPSEKNKWVGLKTVGELRQERNIRNEANLDSLYTPVERNVRVFKPLVIPRSLQKELPYKDKPKLPPLSGQVKSKFENRRVAVVREPNEEKIAQLAKRIRTINAYKQEQLNKATKARFAAHKAKLAAEEAKKLKHQKVLKKQIFRDLSKLEAKNKKY